MSKKITRILLLLLLSCQITNAQGFLTVEHLVHFTPEELGAKFFFITTFDYGADAYKVTYESLDLDGNTVTVSGMLAVPDDPTKVYPFACYQHGTAGFNDDVPSGLGLDSDIPIAFAGKGYVTVAPDLLGLGVHPGVHPYIHAASAVWVAVDMMQAGREYAAMNDIFINDQVFVSGYSQGGHSAMALHRHLEAEMADEFIVTAAAPMSGPYSVAEVMRDLILSEEEYTRPGYLINTFISYQTVYGDIYPDVETAFRAPYRQVVEDYSNELISLSKMDSLLVGLLETNEGVVIPLRLLEESYVQAVVDNPDHPMNLAMLENNVYDWSPQAPTRLYYCEMDEEVPYENSLVAEAAMIANGAPDVQAISASPVFGHFLCALPASLATVGFFADYQVIEDATVASREVIASALDLYPNPAANRVFLKNFPADGELRLFDLNGKMKKAIRVHKGNNELYLSELSGGMYILEIIGQDRIWTDKLMVK